MEKENLFRLNEEAKTKLIEKISSEAFKTFVDSVKGANDSGTFEVIITTENVDRMNEVVKVDGWDFANYMKSPVVLWGHNYDLPPIGICLSLEKVDGGNGGLKATGKFAPTAFAQEIRTLYDLGMCRATSVGFIVNEQDGNIITKAELLEFSFVSVPANPYALSLRDAYNVSENTASMIFKGIKGAIDAKKKEDEAIVEAPKEEIVIEIVAEEIKEEVIVDEKEFTDMQKFITDTITALQTLEKKDIKDFKTNLILTLENALKVTKDFDEGSEGGESDEEEIDEPEIDEEIVDEEVKSFLEKKKLLQSAVNILSEVLAEVRQSGKRE